MRNFPHLGRYLLRLDAIVNLGKNITNMIKKNENESEDNGVQLEDFFDDKLECLLPSETVEDFLEFETWISKLLNAFDGVPSSETRNIDGHL